MLSNVADHLILAWIKSKVANEVRDNAAAYLNIIKMSDAEKAADIVSFLTSRMTDNSIQINNLHNTLSTKSDALAADNIICANVIKALT